MPEIELSRPGFIDNSAEISNVIEVSSWDDFGLLIDTVGIVKVPSEVEILCDDGCGIAYRIEPIGFYRDLL